MVTSPVGDRVDPWHWMRDDSRQSDEVIAHLTAENRYARGTLDGLRPAMGELLFEMRRRIEENDCGVAVALRGSLYQSCYHEGLQYPVHSRRATRKSRRSETVLDVNELAAGHRFFALGAMAISPDNRLVAWTEDSVGQRRFRLRIREIATGKEVATPIDDVAAPVVFAADGVIYIAKDPVTLRGDRVLHRPLSGGESRALYREDDARYQLTVRRSRSDRFIVIGASSTIATEWRYADTTDPSLVFRVIAPREAGHEYEAEDHGDEWILLSNRGGANFGVWRAPIGDTLDPSRWREWVAHDAAHLLESMTVLERGIVIAERHDGLKRLRVKSFEDNSERYIGFPDTSHVASAGANPDYRSETFRLVYSSLSTPNSVYDYHLRTGALTLLKREPVLGKFRPTNYVSELIFVPARDGARIPVSLLYRKRFANKGKAPMLITGYGAYGTSTDPHFNVNRLSLIDRGVLFAIAHVRGGEEMGRNWYADGRHHNKLNSFHDFIDVTDFLVKSGRVDEQRIIAQGSSAGGLLVGAVANMAPDRFNAIIAHVPFVDVVTSMLDANLPLTAQEYGEWGNPSVKEDYDYMLRYSPYDNVRAQAYPAIMVTAGLFDTQVPYWEPAKWVAKLRSLNESSEPITLMTNLHAGHVGSSGRYRRLKEHALTNAFILDRMDIRVHITKKRNVNWPKRTIDGEFVIGTHRTEQR